MHRIYLVIILVLASATVFPLPASAVQGSTGQPVSADAAFERAKFEEALSLIHSMNAPDRGKRISALLEEIRARNPSSAYLYAAEAAMQYQSYKGRGATAQEVMALAQRAIELGPDIADAYIPMAQVCTDERHYAEAKRAADAAIRLAPGKPEAMFAQAHLAEALRDFDGAEKWYLKNIEALPAANRKSNIYYWLSEMYMKKNPPDFDKALAARTKTVELDPEEPYKLCEMSRFLNRYTDRYDEAIEYAMRTWKIRDVCSVRYNLGVALYARWADGYLHPAKLKAMQVQPKPPELIREETGLSFEKMFADAASYKTSQEVPAAMLEAGMIKNVDGVPAGGCCTALHAAAYANNLKLAKLLISKGANVNAQEQETKATPLSRFVEARNVEAVQFLVAKGARVNTVDYRSVPVLNRALRNDDPDQLPMTKALLAAGADPSLPNGGGANLLIEAATGQKDAAIRLLLSQYHLNVNAKDAQGNTALIYAVVYVLGKPEKMKRNVALLLAAGANPWITWGIQDVMGITETQQLRYPDYAEVAAMLREARTHFPKPEGFVEWRAPAQTGNR